MYPSKHSDNFDEQCWSEMVESLRKDIECLFGELKAAFSILKFGPRFRDLDVVDDIFLACCAMHNQRKRAAGLDKVWAPADLDEDDPEEADENGNIQARLTALSSVGGLGRGGGDHRVVVEGVDSLEALNHDQVKNRLVTHFKHAYEKGEVEWPTREGGKRLVYRQQRK
jgi:hypothetical protein